ncbi:hypothetical protein WJX77_005180 [Trebouxia sp. C0004]
MFKAKQFVTPAESSSASGGAAAALQCKPSPMSTVYEGRSNHAKAHRSGQGDEPAKKKKAEINEPEPSGSELGTVDDLEDYSSQEKD